MRILVTGANGQLGQSLQRLCDEGRYEDLEFDFKSSSELDITNDSEVMKIFQKGNYHCCINCAAYTQVDKAESDSEKARLINVQGVENLIEACQHSKTVLIHISTDFVFEGNSKTPYTEEDLTGGDLLGVYASTKMAGEALIESNLKRYFIIRTSWLYSEYGHNFMKTMIRLGKEKEQLSVVNDQTGTPTYAKDLAVVILQIIQSGSEEYGLYHYSNEGQASWYGFAKAIFELKNTNIDLQPISTSAYPTAAKRPKYSVLDKSKIKKAFDLQIPHWKDSLKKAVAENSKLED